MGNWVWLLIAVVTLLVEVVTVSSLISIWFTVGAVFAYGAALLGLGTTIEIIVFILVSVLAFLSIRPLVLKYLTPKNINTNADRLIGVKTRLVEDVYSDKWGAVILEGIRWSVRELNNNGLKRDTLVEVVALEGAKLVVREVK